MAIIRLVEYSDSSDDDHEQERREFQRQRRTFRGFKRHGMSTPAAT